MAPQTHMSHHLHRFHLPSLLSIKHWCRFLLNPKLDPFYSSPMVDVNMDSNDHGHHRSVIIDPSLMYKETKIPKEFVWPKEDRTQILEELNAPVVDLSGFFKGDEEAITKIAELVRSACEMHGFFQVINHGVDADLAKEAITCMNLFFSLPHEQKLIAQKKAGSVWGYTVAHSDRFGSLLPWKEMLSFGYNVDDGVDTRTTVVGYFNSIFGNDYEKMGWVYQKYGNAMNELSMSLMEILAIGLGVERSHYRNFFKENSSIMRCNYYPICQEPDLALGTGPHCDPNALTVLQQDDVKGLEVFTGGQWYSVSPVSGAFVINVGDTFVAMSNGKYKSCMHRAVVNSRSKRNSVVFFLCPKEEKMVSPPAELVTRDGGRKYPDFKWSQLLSYTQKHYRVDIKTIDNFTDWLQKNSS